MPIPLDQTVPATAFKPISSFDVIEGSPDRKTYTSVGFKGVGKSDRHLITESNFFTAADKQAAEKLQQSKKPGEIKVK